MTSHTRSVFLYDGQCGICQEWVDYWQNLTRDEVHYRPYQDAAGDFPQLAEADLAEAVHLIQPDGTISKGAEATFGLYKDHLPHSLLLFLYRKLPGFALLSEMCYRFFSTHRGLLAFITHLCWGRGFEPARYEYVTWLFLRLLGLIYLVAFISFSVQSSLLIGEEGVLPLEYFLSAVYEQLGNSAYFQLPTLFWFSHADGFIHFISVAGILLSLCLVCGFMIRTCLVLLYVCYLSIVNGSQIFMTFQWDVLLLECGFLAIFLPWGSAIIVWLYRWLLFRFMFLGGVVKLTSDDPSWENLTALYFHFETQPLPTPLAWYAHHLPDLILKSATGLTLLIEIFLPFLIFAPRRFRIVSAFCFLLFQLIIFLTGNYNFFNLLAIFMCLFLFDDAAIMHLLPRVLYSGKGTIRQGYPGKTAMSCIILMAVISIYMGTTQIYRVLTGDRTSQPSMVYQLLMPFSIVNPYGPFAVMTTQRNEIVLEGTEDLITWREYHFKYKPGDPEQCPGWVAPHQPRIDWQLWFAALGKPERQRWLMHLMIRILQDSAPVKSLFENNPFPDSPPVSLRARYYHYTFTSIAERRETRRCWNRRLLGEYYQPMRFQNLP